MTEEKPKNEQKCQIESPGGPSLTTRLVLLLRVPIYLEISICAISISSTNNEMCGAALFVAPRAMSGDNLDSSAKQWPSRSA